MKRRGDRVKEGAIVMPEMGEGRIEKKARGRTNVMDGIISSQFPTITPLAQRALLLDIECVKSTKTVQDEECVIAGVNATRRTYLTLFWRYSKNDLTPQSTLGRTWDDRTKNSN